MNFKSPLARKLFITLVLLLFLFPFISWYYLQRGLTWRKEAQQLMQGTTPFPEGEWRDLADNKFSPEAFDQHVTLVTLASCENLTATDLLLDEFYGQFLESAKANFIVLDSCNAETWIDSTRQNWYVFDCKMKTGICAPLIEAWPQGKQHALVDKNGVIRSYYSSVSKEEKRMLLEHMALLLPRDRSEKVELKRGAKK